MTDAMLTELYAFCEKVPCSVLLKLANILRLQKQLLPAEAYASQVGLTVDVTAQLRTLLQFFQEPLPFAASLEVGVFFRQKANEKTLDFVWSGPSKYLEVRKTEQVILDLILKAQKEIFLVSFAAYKIPTLLSALQESIARGVKVSFILENSEDSEGQLSVSAGQAFHEITGAIVYHWPKEQRGKNKAGRPAKMHAKCAVNESSFLITSANLTEDAISTNMELGILCHDCEKTQQLIEQFYELISTGVLKSTRL